MAFGLLNIVKPAIEPAVVSLSDPLSEAATYGLKKFTDTCYYKNPFLDGIKGFLNDLNIGDKNKLLNRSVKIGLEVLVGSALGFLLGMSLLEIGIVLSIGVFSKLLTYAIKWLGINALDQQHAAHRCIKLAAGLLAAGLFVLVKIIFPTFLVRLTPIGLFATAVAPGIIDLSCVFIKFFRKDPGTEKTPSGKNKENQHIEQLPFVADVDEVAKEAGRIDGLNAPVPKEIVSKFVVMDAAKNRALKKIQGKEENGKADPENVSQDNLASLSENGTSRVFPISHFSYCMANANRAAFLAQLLKIPNECIVIEKDGNIWSYETKPEFLSQAIFDLKHVECIVISSAHGSTDPNSNPIYSDVNEILDKAKKNAPANAQIFVVRNSYKKKDNRTNVRTGGTVEYYAPRCSSPNWKITKKFDLTSGQNIPFTDKGN